MQPLAGLIKSLSSSDTLTFITFTLCSCLYESFFTSLHKFHGVSLSSHCDLIRELLLAARQGTFFFQCSSAAAGTSKTCHCQVDTSQVFIRYSTFSALDICGTLAVLYLHILHIIYIILYSIDELHNILISIERSVAHVAIVTLAERLDWSTAAAQDLQTT